MLRAIILSLILFVAFGTLVPISTEFSEASVRTQQRKYKKKKRAKKYRRQARRKRARRRTKKKRKLMSDSAWRRFTARRRARRRARTRRARSKRSKRVRRKRKSTKRTVAKRRVRSKRKARPRTKKKRRLMSDRAWRRFTAKRRSARRRAVAKKTRRSRRPAKRKRVRKYSKKWWANYRAKQRRKKAIAARKRSLRLRKMRSAKKRSKKRTPASARYSRIKTSPNAVRTKVQSAGTTPVPQIATGDLSVDVVGAATGQTVTRGRNTLVGGVSTTTLRRTVIDQMIRDSGWVENDYHKEIGGKKVYVVVAKAPDKNNNVQSRTYYFTESNGRIYRVATRSSQNAVESAQERSEKAIRSLDNAARPQQAQNQ